MKAITQITGTPHHVKQIKPNNEVRKEFITLELVDQKKKKSNPSEQRCANNKTKLKFCEINKIDPIILTWRNSYEKKAYLVDDDEKVYFNTKGLKSKLCKADYLCGIVAKDLKPGHSKKYFFSTINGLLRESFTIKRIA